MILKNPGLRVKFTAIALVIGFLSFAVSFLISYRYIISDHREHLLEEAQIIRSKVMDDFKAAMLSRDHSWVHVAMYQLLEYPHVRELRLFDAKGREIFPGRAPEGEGLVTRSLRAGETVVCEKSLGNVPVSTFVLPLANEKLCQICHDQANGIQGALLLSLSTEDMTGDVISQGRRFSLLFGLAAVFISLCSILTANRLFLIPLGRLREGARAIERGELRQLIPVSSRDEIGLLTEDFNRMSRDLASSRERQERYLKEWIETFDSIKDMIAILDREMTVTRANRAFMEYFSLEKPEGRGCRELFGEPLCANPPGGQQTRELYDKERGRVLEISLFPYLTLPEAGSILVAKDITEKKEAETRMMMSERLLLLGQMSSGIAHEINNPLATIKTCAEGIGNRMRKGECATEVMLSYLRIINEEVSRCKEITDSMLGFVRTGSKKDIVSVSAVLDRSLELMRFQGRLKSVEVERRYTEGATIFAREGDLKQVFLAIIINALDAMEDRGRLTLEIEALDKRIVVRIGDTGPGIPPERLPKIFEPFYTSRGEGGVTGLGLSIAKKIVADYGGEIGVRSEKGEGTVFTVTLPA